MNGNLDMIQEGSVTGRGGREQIPAFDIVFDDQIYEGRKGGDQRWWYLGEIRRRISGSDRFRLRY